MAAALEQPQLARCRAEIRPGGLPEAIARYATDRSPDLLILQTRDSPEVLLERIDALAEVCEPTTRVLLIGAADTISLYRALLQRGVTQYLLQPVSPQDLIEAVGELFADPSAQPRGRVVAVMGAKGGVGSSTIAHNLAWFLADKAAEDICLVDLDLHFGSAGIVFEGAGKNSLVEALNDPDRLDEVALERFMVEVAPRLQVLAGAPTLTASTAVEQPMIERLLDLLRRMHPLVVLDLPHLWAPWVVDRLVDSDDVVFVAQPDLVNVRNLGMLLRALGPKRPDSAPARYILNQVGVSRANEPTARDFREAVGTPPLAEIPFDANLFRSAANNGKMIGEATRRGSVVRNLAKLANTLESQTKPPTARPPAKAAPFDWLRRRMR